MKLRSLRERFASRPRLLVITAVEAERDAVLRGLGLADRGPGDLGSDRIIVEAGGVGPAAAAAATGHLLGMMLPTEPFDVVVSAGVAGGFAGRAPLGSTVLANRSVAADLGADTPDGFATVSDLDLGPSTMDVDAVLQATLRTALPAAIVGDVLTVSTVTGTRYRADELLARWPDAVAEGMEGFGVASAAARAGAAFAELRTISNPVGPRARDAWRIADALAALELAAAALASLDS
jgi:futalosine hydrolase